MAVFQETNPGVKGIGGLLFNGKGHLPGLTDIAGGVYPVDYSLVGTRFQPGQGYHGVDLIIGGKGVRALKKSA